ncbi:capsular associated protein [Trichosporon asahii var. asahii CBS 8904]|uniref:Capsular associated protein n=1 Tax=Trichosporon asahii var. asahii (strain CBS 8904) TaxID=1220162 RepID=K1VVN7_TRIAC|nr:capsular associated protein [Trichosporon asahii var. asahii CBS 8904]
MNTNGLGNLRRRLNLNLSPPAQRLAIRVALFITGVLLFRSIFSKPQKTKEIQSHGMFQRVLMADRYLDTAKHPWLQSRIGRDDRPDMFDEEISDGIWDFWTRYQKPFITGKDTAHLDTQIMRSVVDDLLQFNGWVAAACPTLIRPFGQNTRDDNYEDLANADNLYYVALVVHSADHFLVDQLAIIVQLARRLGTRNIFVSMLDQGSNDATPTLSDLCEAVLTILGISFRIRRVPPLTIDYYPLEEAAVRNLVLEPLHELHDKRNIKFHRVIWLKGFTCPMDVLESLRVSEVNNAAMVCGMDWAEHNGFFIFSDRWRTRDIAGDLFRQARSSSKPEAGPPRDKVGTQRYAHHLPFQVFCCESGTHVVDPELSYYRGIKYRASPNAVNLTESSDIITEPETPCMDSTQMWFCRDLWVDAARNGQKSKGHTGRRGAAHHKKRKRDLHDMDEVIDNFEPVIERQKEKDAEAAAKGAAAGAGAGAGVKGGAAGAGAAGAAAGAGAGAAAGAAAGKAGVKVAAGEDDFFAAAADPENVEPIVHLKEGVITPDGIEEQVELREDIVTPDGVTEVDVEAERAVPVGKAGAQGNAPPLAAAADGGIVQVDAGAGAAKAGKAKMDAADAQVEAAVRDADPVKAEAKQVKPGGKKDEIREAIAADMAEDPAAQPEHADSPGDRNPNAAPKEDSGTNIDAMDDKENPAPEALKKEDLPSSFMIPNSEFEAARILVNPRCLTTYGGVSHSRLALDLFGGRDHSHRGEGNYMVEDWAGAPDSFVCQEMRTVGGRTAPKSQRRVSFLLQNEVGL